MTGLCAASFEAVQPVFNNPMALSDVGIPVWLPDCTSEHTVGALLTAPVAAYLIGMDIRKDNLLRAFDTPKVRAVYQKLVEYIRQNVGQQAYMRIVELSQTAKSETVRADCNKWLAGVDNIAPVKKVEANHQHQVAFGGFEVVLDRSDDNEDDPKDVTPFDGASLIIDDRHV